MGSRSRSAVAALRPEVRRSGGARGSAAWRLRRSSLGVVAVATLTLAGCGSAPQVQVASSDAPPPVAAPVAPPELAVGDDGERDREEERPADDGPVLPPTRVRIDAIGVDAPLDAVGLDEDRVVVVPDDIDVAGWYELLAAPGDAGPTVVVGHVDGGGRAGVFHRLGTLDAGDRIELDRGDGRTVTYQLLEVTQVPKVDFPTRAIFGDPRDDVLHLITCGGPFDRAAGAYRDNVIATAVQVS